MALTTETVTKDILLGSGELYCAKTSEITNLAQPTETDLARFINLGAIKENATISIKNERQDIKAANRGLIDKFLKERTVTFKAGVISFNLENLYKFIYGGEFSDDTTAKVQSFSIGNDDVDKCYLMFVHTNKDTGKKLTARIPTAIFTGDQEFSFGEDAVLTNYEFAALATDISGKIKYVLFDNDYNNAL